MYNLVWHHRKSVFNWSTDSWIMQNWVDTKHGVAKEKKHTETTTSEEQEEKQTNCCWLPVFSRWVVCILFWLKRTWEKNEEASRYLQTETCGTCRLTSSYRMEDSCNQVPEELKPEHGTVTSASKNKKQKQTQQQQKCMAWNLPQMILKQFSKLELLGFLPQLQGKWFWNPTIA